MKERSIGSWEDKRKDIMSEPEVDEFPRKPSGGDGERGREGERAERDILVIFWEIQIIHFMVEADSKRKKTFGWGSTCRQPKNAYATMQKGKAATSLPNTVLSRGPSQQYPCHFIRRVNVMLVNTYREKSILDFCSSLCKPLLRRVKFSKPNFCCYPSFLDHRNTREPPSSQQSKSWFFGISKWNL